MTKKIALMLAFAVGSVFSQQKAFKSMSSDGLEPSDANSISVTIGGAFSATGTYSASPNDRVNQFLTRITKAINISNANKDNIVSDAFSKRNIVLKRFSGENIVVDLLKFEVTGDYKYNPLLKNDDILLIPPLNLEKNFIAINGAVNSPKTFQFVDGDKLSDAIIFAQGINPIYTTPDSAIISRLSYNGEKEDVITVSISADPALQRADRIRIIAPETERIDYKVLISGEVNYPGSVSITKNNTTIRDIIQKAGGFKDNADLGRAEIIRGANVFRSTLFTEDFENSLMSRMSRLNKDDSLPFVIDNKLRFSRGTGTVDFNKIFDDTFNDGKFIIKNGDYIFIPEKLNLVYVFGQVNFPGYVDFVNGKELNFYLQKAGGLGITAKNEVYLIKGKTRNWISLKNQGKNHERLYSIEPGDYIWVPKKPIRSFDYYLQKTGAVAAVFTGVMTILVLLIQVTR